MVVVIFIPEVIYVKWLVMIVVKAVSVVVVSGGRGDRCASGRSWWCLW